MNEPRLEIEYYLFAVIPIKLIPDVDGSLYVLQLDFITGRFVSGKKYYADLPRSDEVEKLDRAKFIGEVEAVRAKRVKGKGCLFDRYASLLVQEKLIQEAQRQPTEAEKNENRSARNASYYLFREIFENDAAWYAIEKRIEQPDQPSFEPADIDAIILNELKLHGQSMGFPTLDKKLSRNHNISGSVGKNLASLTERGLAVDTPKGIQITTEGIEFLGSVG